MRFVILCLMGAFAAFTLPGIAADLLSGSSHRDHETNYDDRIVWRYYDVSGLTREDTLRSMLKNAPHRYWGKAIWTISWSRTPCTAEDISTKLVISLPRHRDYRRLDRDLRMSWDMMMSALISHEANHIEHGLMALEALIKEECRNGDQILSYFSHLDILYDRRTNHGRSEGVLLLKPEEL